MSAPLSPGREGLPWYRRDILSFLDDEGYYTARQVGQQVWKAMSVRTASAAAVQHLKLMEANGLVERAHDGQKPHIWRRTPAGRAALAASTRDEDEAK